MVNASSGSDAQSGWRPGVGGSNFLRLDHLLSKTYMPLEKFKADPLSLGSGALAFEDA